MANIVIGGPYETPKKPFAIKTLYTRTWQAPYVHGVNETWAKRAFEYWERIEQRFGVVMSDHRNAHDEETGTITTFATCIAILKGERYPARQSEELH